MFYRNYNLLLRWVLLLRGVPLCFLAFLAFCSFGRAQSVSLGWNADTGPTVTGYRLYYGTSSGSYTTEINVGNTTTATVSNLPAGATYYFVVTAYDASGLESSPSDEVSYSVASQINPPPNTVTATNVTANLSSSAPITINVLAYDSAANGSALSVVSVTSPAHGSVAINGTGTITYTPGNGFAGEDTFNYTVSDRTGDTATAAVTVVEPFLLGKGTYYGLISAASVNASQSGSITLSVTNTGKFSGHVKLGSHNISVSGTFGLDGTFVGTIAAKNEPVITLDLSLDSVDGLVTGTVSGTGYTSSLSASSAGYSSKNPAPQAGSYTILFTPSSETPSVAGSGAAPQGYGYGRVVVTTTGLAKFNGALADGTHFSFSTPLSRQGTFPFFAVLYSGKGSIAGMVDFRSITTPGSQSDLNGALEWIRPAKASGPFAPGFSTSIAVIGSAYAAPQSQNQILSAAASTPNATVTLSDGNLPASIIKQATLTANSNALLIDNPGSDKTSITFNPSTGLFTGSFYDVSTSKSRPLAGAIFQKQSLGGGYFLGSNSSGSVVIAQ